MVITYGEKCGHTEILVYAIADHAKDLNARRSISEDILFWLSKQFSFFLRMQRVAVPSTI